MNLIKDLLILYIGFVGLSTLWTILKSLSDQDHLQAFLQTVITGAFIYFLIVVLQHLC